MSCQINVLSSICDVREIRKKLFPNWTDTLEVQSEGDWDNFGWQWKDDAEEDSKDELSYFQQCLVALSPVGDVMVIAHTRIATFLTLKWDNALEGNVKEKFVSNATELLTDDEEDHVTCIICLPLASQKRSLHGRPDWTAIIMGFSSGQVKIYTENGVLLISQKFHEEAVTKIKCRTFDHPHYRALAEQHEELVILYKKAVVTVDGFSLYQTLRACRNQAAKATASGNEIIEAPPVAYKKWGFQAMDIINDCESVGIAYSNLFDNMMCESISHRYQGFSRSVFPTSSLFITTGQAPYLSFFYAVEGSAPSLAMEVAMAAAQKLKSLFTGLFGRSSRVAADKKPPKIEPSTPLASRFELRDFTRLGLRISASPNRRLSVVTDDFGRVILIDNYEGVSIRVWKGYRDAQCGWVEASEDTPQTAGKKVEKGMPRTALFLAIYCPRRGILEIWAMQQGPRVAAFNVSKSASLVSCTHGILGLADVRSVIDGRAQTHYCYLVDSDGQVKTISVPFHYALSARHSKRARDMHLLKKLKARLKKSDYADERLVNDASMAILDIKTANVRQEALNAIIHNNHSTHVLLKTSISRLVDSLQNQDPDSLDFESKLLLLSCRKQQQLLQMFEGLQLFEKSSCGRAIVEESVDHKPSQALSEMFHLCYSEVELLLGKVDRYLALNQSGKSVHFEDATKLPPGKFLTCFQTSCSHMPRAVTASSQEYAGCSNAEKSPTLEILVEPHLSRDQIEALALKLYRSAVKGDCYRTEFEGILIQSGIAKKDLLILLIEYWLQMEANLSDYQCLHNCYTICKFLSYISDPCEVIAGYNEVSSWWERIRNLLASSTAVAAAFTAALICRGVAVTLATAHQAKAIELEVNSNYANDVKKEEVVNFAEDASCKDSKDVEMATPIDVSLSDWENVDMDTEMWSLLVKQLEDLVVLNTLLNYKIPPCLCAENLKIKSEDQEIKVSTLSEKGRGVISELVAIWLIRIKFDAVLNLGAQTAIEKSELPHITACDAIDDGREALAEQQLLHLEELKEIFEATRQHFPRSLNWDVLMANCCWEFGAIWNKDRDIVKYLHNAILCLEQISTAPCGKGLATFLWHTFMKETFRSTATLMEKVGKVPKERLCRKDLGMSDVSLEKFMACCVKLLDILMRVCFSRKSQSILPFQCEEPWQNTTGPQPLVDIAALQKEPNYAIVCHHYKLALSMHLMLVYSMKAKPISLFDSRSKAAFFCDLHSNVALPEVPPDSSTVSSRSQFLSRAITAAVLSIPEPDFSGADGMHTASSAVLSTAKLWIEKVMELATLWELDNDILWRHYVCELYNSGLDSLAEEILPSVTDREVMGSQLILLVGQRIYSTFVASDKGYVEKMAMFPPTVTTWLMTLNQNSLRCPNPPLQMTVSMIAYIINAIPEDQAVHKMAVRLIEPLQHILNSNDSAKDLMEAS